MSVVVHLPLPAEKHPFGGQPARQLPSMAFITLDQCSLESLALYTYIHWQPMPVYVC